MLYRSLVCYFALAVLPCLVQLCGWPRRRKRRNRSYPLHSVDVQTRRIPEQWWSGPFQLHLGALVLFRVIWACSTRRALFGARKSSVPAPRKVPISPYQPFIGPINHSLLLMNFRQDAPFLTEKSQRIETAHYRWPEELFSSSQYTSSEPLSTIHLTDLNKCVVQHLLNTRPCAHPLATP